MKLATFSHDGTTTWGALTDAGLVDLRQALDGRYPSIRDLLAADGLAQAKAALSRNLRAIPLDEVTFLPVIPNPDKIVCAGVNYEEHRIEANIRASQYPTIFLRVPGSQTGHDRPIPRPPESVELDYEGEIAIVIGKPGRRISPDAAFDHVAGYAPYNDASIRDWQRHSGQWMSGKNFAETGAFGPWMMTSDEIAPGEVLTVETRLNGQVMQHAATDMMIFSIPELIAYVSAMVELLPGDVIVTGTPGGVGVKRTPQVFMKPGDVVEVEVSRIGVLRNAIVAE